MTGLYANALEQDADDDADVVDSWVLYLRAPALTLDASEVLQSLVQTTVIRPSTYLLTYFLPSYEGTYFLPSYMFLTFKVLNMSLD